jgi:hypothetical protein
LRSRRRSETDSSFQLTGFPALLLILVLLALLVIGIVSVVRFVGRRARGE